MKTILQTPLSNQRNFRKMLATKICW